MVDKSKWKWYSLTEDFVLCDSQNIETRENFYFREDAGCPPPKKKKNESEISIKKKKFQTVFICSKLQYIYWNCPPPTSRNVRVPNHVRSRRNVSACQVTVGYLRNRGIVESDSGYCSINFSRKCLFASLNDFLF